MTSILPSAGWGSDPDTDEEERQLQIKYEDTIFPDGRRSCYDCEIVQDGSVMKDWEADGYIWKLCSSCYKDRNKDFEPAYGNYGIDPYREFGIAEGFENTYIPDKEQ